MAKKTGKGISTKSDESYQRVVQFGSKYTDGELNQIIAYTQKGMYQEVVKLCGGKTRSPKQYAQAKKRLAEQYRGDILAVPNASAVAAVDKKYSIKLKQGAGHYNENKRLIDNNLNLDVMIGRLGKRTVKGKTYGSRGIKYDVVTVPSKGGKVSQAFITKIKQTTIREKWQQKVVSIQLKACYKDIGGNEVWVSTPRITAHKGAAAQIQAKINTWKAKIKPGMRYQYQVKVGGMITTKYKNPQAGGTPIAYELEVMYK